MTSSPAKPRLPTTAVGTNLEAYRWGDWGLLVGIAVIWGSSFLFMAIGLEDFRPGVITLARVGLGAAALALFPASRSPVDPSDLRRIALLGVVWIAIPLSLFPIAQQWIDSSVAGMINGAVPILSAIWATALMRRLPGRRQLIGIGVGFLGMVAVFLPELSDSSATATGAGLALVAVILYGFATNIAVPLQQRYGALPVLLRAQITALVLVVPVGLFQLPGSRWAWDAALMMLPLGVLGTGFAFVMLTTLVGRVGGPRGAISVYFVPVVAIALGVIVRDEKVAPLAIAGVVLVLAGAWIASRREG